MLSLMGKRDPFTKGVTGELLQRAHYNKLTKHPERYTNNLGRFSSDSNNSGRSFLSIILCACESVAVSQRKSRKRRDTGRSISIVFRHHAKPAGEEKFSRLAVARNANRDRTVSRVLGIRPVNGSDLNLAANFKVFLLETAPFQLAESESVDRLFLASRLAPFLPARPGCSPFRLRRHRRRPADQPSH